MEKNMRLVIFILIIALTMSLTSTASAALNNIQKGNTVFLGEQGLVLANTVFYSSGGAYDEQLAYFAGSNPAVDAPDYVFTPTKTDFYVSPFTFSDRLGQWYSYPNGSKNGYVSIDVVRPSLDLRLWAYRSGGESFDITNGKIVKGEALDFRIDSNLYPIFQRTGVLAGDLGVDIKVQNQVGATLTALIDCTGTTVSVVRVHPTNQQFFLPVGALACVWDTGNDQYRTGSYTVWAECNVNGMKDNLGPVLGETITPTLNSLKSTPTPTATATATATMTVTANPTTEQTAEPVVTEITSTPVPAETTPALTAEKTTVITSKATSQPAELPQTPLSPLTLFISVILATIILVVLSKKE